MKLHVFVFLILLFIALSEAWFTSSSSRSSSRSSSGSSWVRNTYNKVRNWAKDKVDYATGYVKGAREMAKAYNDAREMVNGMSGKGGADSRADQEANKWGRNGGDPNKYRPKGLPKKYKREV